jgi:hypothetical protein
MRGGGGTVGRQCKVRVIATRSCGPGVVGLVTGTSAARRPLSCFGRSACSQGSDALRRSACRWVVCVCGCMCMCLNTCVCGWVGGWMCVSVRLNAHNCWVALSGCTRTGGLPSLFGVVLGFPRCSAVLEVGRQVLFRRHVVAGGRVGGGGNGARTGGPAMPSHAAGSNQRLAEASRFAR